MDSIVVNGEKLTQRERIKHAASMVGLQMDAESQRIRIRTRVTIIVILNFHGGTTMAGIAQYVSRVYLRTYSLYSTTTSSR